LSQTGVASIQTRQSGKHLPSSSSICNACGRAQHSAGQTCPAVGKTCHICGKVNHFAPRCPEKGSKPKSPGSSSSHRQENGANTNNHGNKTDGGNSQKSKMARILIGNVKAKQRDRRTPTISVELLDSNGTPIGSFDNVTPDPGAEVSVGGLDFLSAIGLTESDLSTSAFDLVMADKSAPLLSIGQQDVHIRYGKQSAVVPVVICPEIQGVLLSWLDCKDLRILHSEYPLPLPLDRLQSPLQSISDSTAKSPEANIDFLGSIMVPSSPSPEQMAEIKAAIVAHYNDVFDQSAGLRCMVGPERSSNYRMTQSLIT
jgi:hypothetical protein